MLDSVTLRNFQKHRKLKLEFSPEVTTIIGKTDCGKSSVIRALRFVLLNKLTAKPDGYIHWDAKECKVLVKVDGRAVRRTKGVKGSNTYHVDGGQYKFDSVQRKGVPKDIQKILRVDSDNFQRQLDAVFWLADGSAQVARNLNQIVNLESMDASLAGIVKDLRHAKLRVEFTRNRWTQARSIRNVLSWVEYADTLLRQVESVFDGLAVKRSRIAQVEKCVFQATTARATAVRASAGLLEGKKCLSAAVAYLKTSRRAESLKSMLSEVVNLRKIISREIPDIGPLLVVRKRADAFAERRRTLEILIRESTTLEEQSCRLEQSIHQSTRKISRLGRNLICPTCGQTIK